MFSSLSSSSSLIPIFLSLISTIHSHEAPVDGFFKREHSLVKPYSPAGMNIPFFDLTGDTMVTNNFVRLTPDDKSRVGGIWNKVPMNQRAWEVHFTYKVHGHSRNLAADGMALWYVKDPRQIGSVFGGADQNNKFTGLGIFIDTYKNGGGTGAFPQVSGMVNDGTVDYNHDDDGNEQNLGSCYAMVRNREHDTHMSIKYKKQILTVSVDVDGQGNWRQCFVKTGLVLPCGYYFGVTAATGDLSDNHDVTAIRTYQLETDEPVVDCKNLTPGIVGQIIGGPDYTHDDDHRNSKTTGGNGWMWVFVIGILICGVIGLVMFQKKQEAKKHRFY